MTANVYSALPMNMLYDLLATAVAKLIKASESNDIIGFNAAEVQIQIIIANIKQKTSVLVGVPPASKST